MSSIDWAIVVLFVIASVGIGAWFVRRGGKSTEDFFVAGRSLPWYIAGTSMVATTFSSDTPLFIAGGVRETGIHMNWFWWSAGIGSIVCTFFFANLWRRSEAITDVQFISMRYQAGMPVNLLRAFRVLFDGAFINCIIMASVTLAMSKVLVVILGLSGAVLFTLPLIGGVQAEILIIAFLGIAAVLYTMLAGLYGVVYTDLIQFCLAMIGSIALSLIVVIDLQDQGGIVAAVSAQTPKEVFNLFPEFGANLPTVTFLILMTVGWWSTAPGSGYLIQRALATRSERDAVLSVYWFTICHYAVRSWPWIIAGVASLVYFPSLSDAELAYPGMINELMPVGLKGIMVASLLAAFMSTLDTQMNWGASYLITDLYQPFVAKGKSPRHYVQAARVCMLLLTLAAILLSTQLSGILVAYKYLAVMLSGSSFVLIARWYWWRITVWSEIASLVSSFVVGNLLLIWIPDAPGEDWFAVRMLVNVLITTSVCLIVTYASSLSGPTGRAAGFYRKLLVPGPGWSRVAGQLNIQPRKLDLRCCLPGTLASILSLYGILIGFGQLLTGALWLAFLCALVAVIGGFVSIRELGRLVRKDQDFPNLTS